MDSPLSPEETTTPDLYQVARILGMILYKERIIISEMTAIALAEALHESGLLKITDVEAESLAEEKIYPVDGGYVAADAAGWLPGVFSTVEEARAAQHKDWSSPAT